MFKQILLLQVPHNVSSIEARHRDSGQFFSEVFYYMIQYHVNSIGLCLSSQVGLLRLSHYSVGLN